MAVWGQCGCQRLGLFERGQVQILTQPVQQIAPFAQCSAQDGASDVDEVEPEPRGGHDAARFDHQPNRAGGPPRQRPTSGINTPRTDTGRGTMTNEWEPGNVA